MEFIVSATVRVGGVKTKFVLVLVLLGPVKFQFALTFMSLDKPKAP